MGLNIVDIDGATQAPGSATPARGVQVLGGDGTNSRVLLVDASGRPLVTVATPLPAGTNKIGSVQLRNPGDTLNLGDNTNPLRVDPTGATVQPISAASLPLPAGASTEAKQDVIISHVDGIEALLASLDGKDYSTETTLAAIATILTAIRDTAGVKKITDTVQAEGTGVAGTPAGGVLSIQGVAGGEAVPVSQAAASAADIVVQELLNASSPDLRVNGSGTPVNFDFNADPTNDILLSAIRLICNVSTAFAFGGSSFGAGTALTNGISITGVVNGGTPISLRTIKVNEGFIKFANTREPLFSFDGANDVISTQFNLGERVRLVAGTADRMRVTISDDLTAAIYKLSYFQAVLYGVKQ